MCVDNLPAFSYYPTEWNIKIHEKHMDRPALTQPQRQCSRRKKSWEVEKRGTLEGRRQWAGTKGEGIRKNRLLRGGWPRPDVLISWPPYVELKTTLSITANIEKTPQMTRDNKWYTLCNQSTSTLHKDIRILVHSLDVYVSQLQG